MRKVTQCRRALRAAERGDSEAYRRLLTLVTHEGIEPRRVRRGFTLDYLFTDLPRQIGLV